MLETAIAAQERAGDRVSHIQTSYVLGTFYLLITGDYARAEAHLKYGLDNGDCGPLIICEMRARPFLARAYVGMHRLDDADEQLARCRQIMAAGEDWRGRASTIAATEAIIAAARGNYDLAEQQFESALAIQRKYHLMMDECFTLQSWGRVLATSGDRTRAAEKFDAALVLNRSRGVGPRFLEWLAADKMRALGSNQTKIASNDARELDSTKSKSTAEFQREGEFWTIAYAGATFRLKDAKGLHYIAYLLAHPGDRFHVLDLVGAVEGSATTGRTTIRAESEDLEIVRDIGGAGASIDAQARAEYRSRLRDLNADLEEAERMNDLGRAERIRTEIEMVGQELSGSLGLYGHARTASVSAERARVLVANNIRTVLKKIRHEHPPLGRHLGAAIITGYFSAYQPDPDRPISWQL